MIKKYIFYYIGFSNMTKDFELNFRNMRFEAVLETNIRDFINKITSKIKANTSFSKYLFIFSIIFWFVFSLFFFGSKDFVSSGNNIFIKLLYSLNDFLNLNQLFIFSKSGISYSFNDFIQKVSFIYTASVFFSFE